LTTNYQVRLIFTRTLAQNTGAKDQTSEKFWNLRQQLTQHKFLR